MVRPWAISLPFVLLLAACAPKAPELPADEVLRRATLAAQSLSSGSFTADGQFSFSEGAFGSGEGTVRLDGGFENGGQTVGSTVDLSVKLSDIDGADHQIVSVFDLILVQGQRLYMKVHALQTPEGYGILDAALVAKLVGTWWMFDAPKEQAGTPMTPSPGLLKAQASVVHVTRDLGVAKLDKDITYHYAVAIDPEKFIAYAEERAKESGEAFDADATRADIAALQATGELWIRASDFSVRRILWDIPALPLPDGSAFALTFTLDWKDEAQEPIVIPEDAQPFSAVQLLPSDPVFDESPSVPGIPESDLRSATEEYSDTVILPPQE